MLPQSAIAQRYPVPGVLSYSSLEELPGLQSDPGHEYLVTELLGGAREAHAGYMRDMVASSAVKALISASRYLGFEGRTDAPELRLQSP